VGYNPAILVYGPAVSECSLAPQDRGFAALRVSDAEIRQTRSMLTCQRPFFDTTSHRRDFILPPREPSALSSFCPAMGLFIQTICCVTMPMEIQNMQPPSYGVNERSRVHRKSLRVGMERVHRLLILSRFYLCTALFIIYERCRRTYATQCRGTGQRTGGQPSLYPW